MKTQYYTASSLDGFIADPKHSLDWLMQFGEEPGGSYESFFRGVGAMAMGSSTYEWLLDNHLFSDPENPKPWPYTEPSWVFTTRKLREVEGANMRFVRGDVRPVHEEMVQAAGGKNVWIIGGGDLAGQFYDQGLLDEVIVTIAAVTLGAGFPLLPRRIVTPPMRLVSATAYGEAYAELRYEVRREVAS